MKSEINSTKTASGAAYAGALLFTILVILFNTMPQNVVPIVIVAVTFHVLLFPVVAKVPSTDWGRAAGYGWLTLDIAANIMHLNGVDEHITSALRYGAHIPAIIWIIISSLHCNRKIQITGILQALVMGSYSFLAPWVPMWYLYPAMILLIIWLILVGAFLGKSSKI